MRNDGKIKLTCSNRMGFREKYQRSGRREFLIGGAVIGSSAILGLGGQRLSLLNQKASSEIRERLHSLEGQPTPGSLLLGFHPETWFELNPHYSFPKEELLELQKALDRPIHLVGLFGDLYRPWFLNCIDIVEEMGAVPVISLGLVDIDEAGKEIDRFRLRDISEGKERVIEALGMIAEVLAGRGPVVLRFGYEMNGSWFPYGNQPEDFKDAWIFTRELFERVGAKNVIWAFSPSVLTPVAPFFPGEEWVDIIAPDGYDLFANGVLANFCSRRDLLSFLASYFHFPDLSFLDIFGPTILECRTLAPDTPLMVGEIGSGRAIGRAEWLLEALAMIRKLGLVGVIYFNFNKFWMNSVWRRKIEERDWGLTLKEAQILGEQELRNEAWAGELTPEEIVGRLLRQPHFVAS